MQINNFKNINTISCDMETAKKIFNELGILPINEYYNNTLNKNVSVFIKAKKLVNYIKEKGLEVLG